MPHKTDSTPSLRLLPESLPPSGKSAYVSADEIEAVEAFRMGYDIVCRHPNQVGALASGDELVIDGNIVVFADLDAAARVAAEAIQNGVAVGVHTYGLENPALAPLVALPGVVAAKTHREVRAALRRLHVEGSRRRGTTAYVSWDEVERADAFNHGYDAVCQHPNEVAALGVGDELVLDANNIQFGDFDVAVQAAAGAHRNGATIGVHTYNLDNPALAPLLKLPGVTIAKTHVELLAAMQQKRAAG